MQYNELRWQCRRGTKELDAWLNGIMNSLYDHFSSSQKAAFVALLQSSDSELQLWMLRQERPENHAIAALLDHINTNRTPR